MIRNSWLPLTLLALSACCGGACKRAEGVPAPTGSNAAVPAARSAVRTIAFVDQEEACECTRKRINDSWAALQGAMKQSRELPVRRIHRDTQPVDVAPLQAKRTFVAVPAIYLLDASGEVTDKELVAALK